MKVLLDTDTCIHLIRYRPATMLHRLKRYAPGDVGISSITLAELRFGAEKGQQREKNRAALDNFTAPLEDCSVGCRRGCYIRYCAGGA